MDPQEQTENVKSVPHDSGPIQEFFFEEQSARIKAASCKICQVKCPSHMMPRAYFHLDKIGPFKIKPKKGKNETVAVEEASVMATRFVSIYGYNEECKEQIKDVTDIKMVGSVYSRAGSVKYLFDPEILMCCDKIGMEDELDVIGEFAKLRKKEECRKDKEEGKMKKKDFMAKCGKLM